MKQIRELPEFKKNFKNSKTQKTKKKLVMIVTVDRGPDENPRYEKAITYVVNYFSTYDLDAFFLITNAP